MGLVTTRCACRDAPVCCDMAQAKEGFDGNDLRYILPEDLDEMGIVDGERRNQLLNILEQVRATFE
eukprot:m.438552 g.438552  ORF g.438552 m.438552 type:complete len:66 (+) comp21445_c0_seq17:2942-3139(+)